MPSMTSPKRSKPESEVMPTAVGLLIRRLRDEHEPWMPQEELAHRTGFTQSRISKIERGVTKRPPKEDLRAIAKAVGADPDTLFVAADYAPERWQEDRYRQLWMKARDDLPPERIAQIEAEIDDVLERHADTDFKE